MNARRHAVRQVHKVVKRGFQRIAHRLVKGHALVLKLALAGNGLVLQLVHGDLAALRPAHAKYVAGQQRPIGNQRVLGLLGHAHNVHVLRVVGIHIAQVDVDKLDARHNLELFLYATTALDGVVQQPAHIVLVHGLVGEQQLGQTAKGLAHGDLVALVKVAVKAEVTVDMVRKVLAAHLFAKLRQAVGDQTVMTSQQARAHLRNLPARQVIVDTVKEGRIVVKLRRERIKQVRSLKDILHGVVDVALKDHGGIGVNLVAAARIAAARHVVLHDLHGVGVLKAHAGDLVKRHAVPVAHQAHAIGAHGVHAAEQVGRGGLAARKQDGVGRDLFVDMALAGAAGTQLAQVVVALDQRHHALDKVQALFLGKLAGFVASRTQQHVEPLVARKVLALVNHGIQVQIGHLDGRERSHAKRRILGSALFALGLGAARRIVAKDLHAKLIFLIHGMAILDAHNAPNTTLQNLGIVAHVLGRHHKRLDGQVGKRGHVNIFVLVELGRHLIDDGKAAQLANLGLNALGLVGAHVVIGKNPANAVKALRHGFLVIG